MSRKNQNARIQFKYSTIGGVTPTIAPSMDHTDGTWSPTDLYVGEFFLNAVDNTMWVRTLTGIVPLTSGTTSINISQFVNKSGDTMTGTLNGTDFSGNSFYGNLFSGGTFYGDGSGLTGITADVLVQNFTGGTVSGPTTFTNTLDLTSASVSASTIDTTGNLNFINGDVTIQGGNLDVSNAVSATTFYGDGSNLTGISGLTGYFEKENGSLKDTEGAHTISGTSQLSIIAGGNGNSIIGSNVGGIIGGDSNVLDSSNGSLIFGGQNNTIEVNSTASFILGATSNITGGANYSGIFGGTGHQITGIDWGFIVGGEGNTNEGQNYSGIIGGRDNTISGTTSSGVIIGGVNNELNGQSSYDTIIGGYNNTINGTTNTVSNSIIGGNGNTIEGDLDNIIILGGVGITAGYENTTYVNKLNINDVPTGTSLNNLGIDIHGNVVVGTGGASNPTLSQVLTAGNTTGFNWIDVETLYGLRNISGSNERLYSFYGDGLKMETTDGTNSGEISLTDAGIFQVKNTNEIFFDQYFAPSGTTFEVRGSNAGGFQGIQYDDDYSSNYTNRSLVDKEYVDNAVGGGIDGGGSTNQITYWSDSDTVTGSSKFTILTDNSTYAQTKVEGDSNNYITMYATDSGLSNLTLRNEGSSQNTIQLENLDNTATGGGNLLFSRVNASSPSTFTGLTESMRLGNIFFKGNDDNTTGLNSGAEIRVSADENWTTSGNGTRVDFHLTRRNETSLSLPLRLNTQGVEVRGSTCVIPEENDTGGSFTPDYSLSSIQQITLTGNTTIENPTYVNPGATLMFIIKQDGTGGHTVSWGSRYKFPGGTTPTITSAANSVDIVTLITEQSGSNIYGAAVQNFS